MADMGQYNNDTFIDNPLTYLTYARQCAALKNLLPNLAYANDFALNLQPSAYFKLVPGHLTAKDKYARCFYCLTCGQNM
jgi:hypothetical protein